MMNSRPVNPAPPAWMTDADVLRAFAFATEAHKTQVRKYTGEPYIYHPLEVAETLVAAFPDNPPPSFVLCACLLHDVVEDCGVTFTELRREFGDLVATTVMYLTDLVTKEQGNRETRKFMEVERLRTAPVHVHCIKIADMLSNTKSIVANDKDFAVVYMREKQRALLAIGETWRTLEQRGIEFGDDALALYQSAYMTIRLYHNSTEGATVQ